MIKCKWRLPFCWWNDRNPWQTPIWWVPYRLCSGMALLPKRNRTPFRIFSLVPYQMFENSGTHRNDIRWNNLIHVDQLSHIDWNEPVSTFPMRFPETERVSDLEFLDRRIPWSSLFHASKCEKKEHYDLQYLSLKWMVFFFTFRFLYKKIKRWPFEITCREDRALCLWE